jgi:hypothetical protein
MKVDFDLGTMTAFDITTTMKHKSFYTNPFSTLSNIIDNLEDDQDHCFHSTQILESKYDKANINNMVAQQSHLNTNQRSDLHNIVLAKCTKLFSGKLGHYTQQKRCILSYFQDLSPSMQNHTQFLTISSNFFEQSWNVLTT